MSVIMISIVSRLKLIPWSQVTMFWWPSDAEETESSESFCCANLSFMIWTFLPLLPSSPTYLGQIGDGIPAGFLVGLEWKVDY